MRGFSIGYFERRAIPKVPVTVLRNNEKKELEVTLGKRPTKMTASMNSNQKSEKAYSNDKLGLSVQNLTADVAKKLGYSGEEGVIVTKVKAGSPADDAGIQVHDLIKEVNKKEIKSVSQFENIISQTKANTDAFLIQRGNTSFFVAIGLSS